MTMNGGTSCPGGGGLRLGGQYHSVQCISDRRSREFKSSSRFLAYVPFAAIALTITAAAKIELYNYLVCQALKPVFDPDNREGLVLTVVKHVIAFEGKRCLVSERHPSHVIVVRRPDREGLCSGSRRASGCRKANDNPDNLDGCPDLHDYSMVGLGRSPSILQDSSRDTDLRS